MRLRIGMLLAMAALVFDANATSDLAQAMRAYEHGNFVEAERHFRAAAKAGNAKAQEMLGMMYAFGPSMYPGITGDRRRAVELLDLAARQGRSTARFLHCTLMRRTPRTSPPRLSCFDWIAETGQPAPR